MRPLLELSSVSKSFGAVRALRDVSFDVRAGEVHALVGENGAGKSTLIKIITGAHQPDSGTIQLEGRSINGLTPASAHAAGIVAIYQQPALFPHLSVAENIALRLDRPAAMRRVPWNRNRHRASDLLKRIGALIDPETEVHDLSMPEQQLVEIAGALGAGARLLIMDEPTASLTTREVDLLFVLVNHLREQGVGVVYISHRLEEIFRVADRVTVLRDGQTVGTREVPRGRSPARPSDGTTPELTESEIIRLMVGREISTIFPPPGNAPGAPVLSVRSLGCEFSGVHDVTLDVRAGEVLGLAGLVGAGRTELARVLFGITPADRGTIMLAGELLRVPSPRAAIDAGIAYVPEDRRRHGVILEMSVAANISMAIHERLFPHGWLRFGAERALARGQIGGLTIKTSSEETPVGNLSGGNQQKVSLARWLAAGPKVLILDEPTQGVDIGAKVEIHKLIRRLAAQGLAVLMISSELPELLGMSDRIAVMRNKTIVTVIERSQASAHLVVAAALGQSQ